MKRKIITWSLTLFIISVFLLLSNALWGRGYEINPILKSLPNKTWHKMSPTFDPPGLNFGGFGHPKGETSLSYDEEAKVMIFWGGCQYGYTNSTWLYDVTKNEWKLANPEKFEISDEGLRFCPLDDHPPGGCSYGITYIPDYKVTMLFRGYHSNAPGWEPWQRRHKGFIGWLYYSKKKTWKMIPYIKGKIPPHINAASIVYDRYNKRVLLFGGRVRELWAFNIKENQWDKVRTRGDNPPKLAYPSVVYDEKNKKMIVFGGLLDGTHNSSDQTWEYDVVKNSWQLIDAKGPSPRFAAAAAYDSKNGVMVLFGGRWKAKNGKRHALSDTWVYDPTFKKWIEIKTGSHPPNNKTYQAAYDKVNNVVVLLDNKSQTWVFRYKN